MARLFFWSYFLLYIKCSAGGKENMDFMQPKRPKTAIFLPLAGGLALGSIGGFYYGKAKASEETKSKIFGDLKARFDQNRFILNTLSTDAPPAESRDKWIKYIQSQLNKAEKEDMSRGRFPISDSIL